MHSAEVHGCTGGGFRVQRCTVQRCRMCGGAVHSAEVYDTGCRGPRVQGYRGAQCRGVWVQRSWLCSTRCRSIRCRGTRCRVQRCMGAECMVQKRVVWHHRGEHCRAMAVPSPALALLLCLHIGPSPQQSPGCSHSPAELFSVLPLFLPPSLPLYSFFPPSPLHHQSPSPRSPFPPPTRGCSS